VNIATPMFEIVVDACLESFMTPRLSHSRKLIARDRPRDERSGATIATATTSTTDTCRCGRDPSAGGARGAKLRPELLLGA